MTSSPLDSTLGRTSGVTCHHRLWTAHKVQRRQPFHAIIAFGKLTRSNDFERGMPSKPLDGQHGQTTSGLACHYRLWETHTVERRQAWHAISLLGSTHGRTTSGVACHHSPWTAHTVGRQRAWHDITVIGQLTLSNEVRCGMPSSPLDNTHGRQHRAWHDITALGLHTRSATSGMA